MTCTKTTKQLGYFINQSLFYKRKVDINYGLDQENEKNNDSSLVNNLRFKCISVCIK